MRARIPAPCEHFDMEKNYYKDTCPDMIADKGGVSSWNIRKGLMSEGHMDMFIAGQGALHKLPITFDDVGHKLTDIQRSINKAYKMGARMVILDYLQLVSNSGKRKSREREVGEISTMLKHTAKRLKIPIVALAQLNRVVETRENKRPNLSDLRDSGQMEQDADIVIFVHRPGNTAGDSVDDHAEIIVAKGRNVGTCMIKTGWDGPRTRFVEMEG